MSCGQNISKNLALQIESCTNADNAFGFSYMFQGTRIIFLRVHLIVLCCHVSQTRTGYVFPGMRSAEQEFVAATCSCDQSLLHDPRVGVSFSARGDCMKKRFEAHG